MNIDPSTFLSWKDGILIGVIIGQALNARARRSQGERLGIVEKAVVVIAKSAGIDLDDDSSPGKQRTRK